MATFQKRGTSTKAIIRLKGVFESKTFKTKSEAMYWASQREKEIRDGLIGAIPNKTFSELLDRYANEVSPKKRGCQWEIIRIEQIKKDEIGKLKLDVLNESHFAGWRDRRLKTVSNATVRREWNILSNALNIAMNEWKWLKVNPLKSIKKPPAPKPRDRLITQEEIEKVLHCSGYDRNSPPQTHTASVGAIFLFAIETGMRLKEMTRLTWDRVYLDKQYLKVTDDSKTGAREVPLSSEAVRILKQMQSDTPLVFNLTERQVDALFRKIKARAEVSGFTFHDTKHLACTRLSKVLSAFELARMVGTRDLRTLLIYYNESASDIAKKLQR